MVLILQYMRINTSFHKNAYAKVLLYFQLTKFCIVIFRNKAHK